METTNGVMNMKMSDYFALPVLHDVYMQDEHAPVYAADCNKVVFKGWCEPAIELACIAINNHDRLTSENARLLDMLKRLTSHDNCRKDVIHLMSEADSLIQELEKGDE